MPRKYPPGYDFRAAETLRSEQAAQHSRGQQRRPHLEQPAGTGEGQRPCARGRWCASSTTSVVDGQPVIQPALGPRSFCEPDRIFIARCLTELPGQHEQLAGEIGNPDSRNRGSTVRVPFGPSVPIRVDIDALLKLIAESLVSWHERVADVASLDFPANRASRLRRDHVAISRAVDVLAEHLDTLLGLEAAAMSRAWSLRDLDKLPEGASGIVHSVWVDATVDLAGTDAGLEIINLRHLARAVLGETKAKPEELVGVPCRADGCSRRAVYRAELPSHEDEPVWWTECARCGDRMTEADYRDWVALVAAYEEQRRRPRATLDDLPGVA